MLDNYPIFGICGNSGAGKTTLIEKLIPHLRRQGLNVAVVKHDSHGIDVDRPGKDSDRFFQAGADVLLQGPDQGMFRFHDPPGVGLIQTLLDLVRHYDIILVEGYRHTPVAKVWLLSDGETTPPETVQAVMTLPRNVDRFRALAELISDWFRRQGRNLSEESAWRDPKTK